MKVTPAVRSSMVKRRTSMADVATLARGELSFKRSRQQSFANFTAVHESLARDRDTKRVPSTYKDTMKVAAERDALLDDARRYSPSAACHRPRTLSARPSLVPTPVALTERLRVRDPLRAVSLVLALNKLPQTVFARLIWFPIFWILLATYAAIATLSRTGVIDLGEPIPSAFDGASVLVTFMVIFFVGYCYNRHLCAT